METLRVNVPKNQTKFKKCGHDQKFYFAFFSGLLISQPFCLNNASTFIDTKVDKAKFWNLGKLTK